MICLFKTVLRAISRCPPGESEMDAGPAQWAKKLFRGCAAAWFRIWRGELSVHHSIPICRDATREFCEARCPWFPWVGSPIPWAKSAFMLSSGCPCGYQSNGDSKSQSFPAGLCFHASFWIVLFMEACGSALTIMYSGSFLSTVSWQFRSEIFEPWQPWQGFFNGNGTPGQRGTVWLSAAAYDKAAFAGMCSKTLRSQAGCQMSWVRTVAWHSLTMCKWLQHNRGTSCPTLPSLLSPCTSAVIRPHHGTHCGPGCGGLACSHPWERLAWIHMNPCINLLWLAARNHQKML